MNKQKYAGVSYLYPPSELSDYGQGRAIAYVCLGTHNEQFYQLIQHEAAGHCFAKLADEYYTEQSGRISESDLSLRRQQENYGWNKNIDFTSNPLEVKWGRFLIDDRYKTQLNINIHEGAVYYKEGVYRASYRSIMYDNQGTFNAPSREAIYYRIHRLAFGSIWRYNFNTFADYDCTLTPRPNNLPATASPTDDFIPLPPPVIRKGVQ